MRTVLRRSALDGVVALVLALSCRASFGQQPSFQEMCPFSEDRFIVELQQKESWRRWTAAECLGEMKDQSAVEPLVQAILNEDIPRLILVEASALKKIDDPRAEDFLLVAINDKRTRSPAIEALGRLQAKRAVEPIIGLLKNPDRSTTAVAAGSLAEIQDARALHPLCMLLTNRDEVVRRYAAQALGILGEQRASGPLIAALKDPDDGVRWNAASSLGQLKSPEAVDALIAVLNDSEEGVRVAALDALGDIGDTHAVAPIIGTLASGTNRSRWHSASALAILNTPEACDALTNSMRHGDLTVVAAAYKYFLAKNDPDSIEALVAALTEYGWYDMADALLNSGDSRLADAARQWQSRSEVQLQP